MSVVVEKLSLEFTIEAIERAGNEVLYPVDIRAVQKEEVGFLEYHDRAVFSIFAQALRRGQARGESAVEASVRGFLLGTRTVRYVAGEATLPPRPLDAAHNYYSLVQEHPERLDNDFARDYAAHPAITELVERTIENPFTKAHAKLAFNLYGKEANPNRPLELIPSPKPVHKPSRRQFIGAASASVSRRRR